MQIIISSYIKRALFYLIFTSCFLACKEKKAQDSSITTTSNTIPIYDFNTLEPLLYSTTSKTYIVNFWAMWCAPCVKELPYLQQYADQNPNVELLLISLDFPEDIETKLKPFLKKKNSTANVILLDDPDSNTWIDKIDPNWSGSIPFTILFNNKKRAFYERPFEDIKDLENEINKIINN